MTLKEKHACHCTVGQCRNPYFLPFPFVLLRVDLLGGSVSSLSSTWSISWTSSPSSDSSSLPTSSCFAASKFWTRCATTSCGFSLPFHALHPPQRHLPMSSTERAPGGAWPFTSLHSEQIKAMRFLGCSSSSPRRASRMRSYQWACVNEVAGAAEYCFVASTGPNAFGANSAPGEGSSGRG